MLLAQLDADDADLDQVHDLVFARGGTVRSVSAVSDGPLRVSADFPSASDAARAAVAFAELGTAEPDTAPRVALCGPEPGPDGGPDSWAAARAAQVLDRVRPGQILVAAGTAIVVAGTLPRDTVLLDRGNVPLGDGRRAQRVYELRRSDPGSPANLDWARRAVDGSAIALNLAGLASSWQRAAAGAARLVLVSGADGAATTAVLGELALHLHTAGAQVLHGRWDPASPAPYQAYREALGVYADTCDTARLRAELAGHAGGITVVLPDVAARIAGPGATGSSPGEALPAWLRTIARRQATLLVLDGAQWADEASLRLLGSVWHACGQTALMIAVAVSGDHRADRVVRRIRVLGEHAASGAFTHYRL